MEQTDLELQLRVWKKLAVSKQVLMQTATKALGLKAECSAVELETALIKTVDQANTAETEILSTQEIAKAKIEGLEVQLAKSEKKCVATLAEKDAALNAMRVSEEKFEVLKLANAEETKKFKSDVLEMQKESKKITKILADTPDNVVKKMKALKKEKLDETNARKRVEDANTVLRKEKQRTEKSLNEAKEINKQAVKLSEAYRGLHKQAGEQHTLLSDKLDDTEADTLEAMPELDEVLLESIEDADSNDKDSKDKKKKKDKKEKKSK